MPKKLMILGISVYIIIPMPNSSIDLIISRFYPYGMGVKSNNFIPEVKLLYGIFATLRRYVDKNMLPHYNVPIRK